MTFLEMVQQLHRDVGAAGVVPATVDSQTGEALQLVNWIIRSDNIVQSMWHNWKFLRTAWAVNTTAAQQAVTSPTDLNRWDYSTFMLAPIGSAVYDPIQVVEYEEVKREFFSTATADDSTPDRIVVMPDNTLNFDPVPDGMYPFKADYFRTPTLLAANDDNSAIPLEFRYPVIVGRAMVLYGNHENAPEILDQGNQLYSSMLPRLESLQLPNKMDSRFTSTGNTIEVIAE